ncbi:hypothetical protein D9613_012949 [Agrocybe pediades]|uniref:Gti1/Pac2 family-domain-containing protein n=1 Tax=Agrocybe pediades TaxID=84607 RepID=A0A8H4VHN2_9AGAR|nr:hypothetical protein D9613_012949 [Agrocybe pediades]KAF9549072.1 hypothetical protein CPC08DRAFT_648300 [Agrocybe pediades]
MQSPTCVNLRINTLQEAKVIFHAVDLGLLGMMARRLDTHERQAITAGDVYIWEEKGIGSNSSTGIERWTDGIAWGPSITRDNFLYYEERVGPVGLRYGIRSQARLHRYEKIGPLKKQTYSVYVDTPHGQRKRHLMAYFTDQTSEKLQTVSQRRDLSEIAVPLGMYRPAGRQASSQRNGTNERQGGQLHGTSRIKSML